MSLDLLSILSSKDNYIKYSNIVSNCITEELTCIIKELDKYYEEHLSISNIDWLSFGSWFLVRNTKLKKEKKDYYLRIFENLSTRIPDPATQDSIIRTFISRSFFTKMADTALRGAEGDTTVSMDNIEALLDQHDKETGRVDKLDNIVIKEDLAELYSHVVGGGGIDWRLPDLNLSLGPVRKGDFILVGARPETGKTTLLASEATYFATQAPADEHVVWFNNEEEGKKVKWRVIQAALGWTREEMEKDLVRTRDEYIKIVGHMDKVIIVDKTHGGGLHINDVRRVLDKYKPCAILFDQLRKIKAPFDKDANDVARLQQLFQWARELAKEYAPVIGVHQADASAEGVKFIEMNQLYGSKTEIQGEADAIITIGRSFQPGYEMNRYIYLPKNKLAGGSKSKEEFRHGKFEVLIKPEIARYESST